MKNGKVDGQPEAKPSGILKMTPEETVEFYEAMEEPPQPHEGLVRAFQMTKDAVRT